MLFLGNEMSDQTGWILAGKFVTGRTNEDRSASLTRWAVVLLDDGCTRKVSCRYALPN